MAGYSARQSTFTTGDTITAAHSNNEFNAILAAFHVSTGHKHDGSTAGDGGPISTLFSNAISMGTGADTDIALTFNANTNDGVITWMEDQDYFQFSDDILISTTEKLQFRDTAIYINSSADGQLDLVADTEIQIAATTVDINGNVDISGSLTLGGTTITSTGAELNILDGVTSTAAELNILDGVTSTAAELNILDGVTSTTAELNILDGVTSTTAELNLVDGITPGTVTASKAIIVDSDKDLTGIRNLTIAGDLTISGDDLTMATNTAGNLLIADGTNYNPTAVSSLGEISTVAGGDLLLAVDASGGGLKKITRSTLVAGLTAGTEISNLVEDTTPQLGGDLDAQGKDITDVGILSADASAGIYGATGSPVVFTVTVASKTSAHPYNGDGSSSGYFLNGVESPALKLHGADSVTSSSGYYYKFDQAEGTNSGHPLRFYLDAAKTIAYTTGVTTSGTPGTAGAHTTIAVTDQTPSTLYYQCSSHSYMGNYASVDSANITSSGAVSIDAVGDVTIDADGGDIIFKDAGTTFGSATNTSGDLILKSGTTTALTFSGANATVAGNLVVTGNHTVNGTTTTVNSTTVTIDDPIFTLGGDGTPGSDDNKDRGIEFKYHTGSAAKVGFFGWDDSAGAFTFVPDATNSSEVFSGSVGNAIFGNVTGTLQTAAQTNITSVGALDGGSITSGFGAIDNGTSGIRTNTFTAETSVVPDASGGADLGSTSLEWGDLYIADDKKIYLGSDQNFSIEYDEDGNDTTAVVAAGGVSLAPHGTSTGNGTELRFQELAANGANYVGFKAPDAIASNEVWVLPNADGSDGQVLKTDGSNALSWGEAGGGGTVDMVADGAIAIRKPVILTAAGKAKQLASPASATITAKASTQISTQGASGLIRTRYEATSEKFVMVFEDTDNSSYPSIVAGTWDDSDGSISWGTVQVLNSASANGEIALATGNGRVHVVYGTGSAGSGVLNLRTATVASDNTFSGFSTAVTTFGDDLSGTHINAFAASFDTSTNYLIVTYTNASDGTGNTFAHPFHINGTTYTAGSATTVCSGSPSSYRMGQVFDPDTNRTIIAYKDNGNSGYTTANVLQSAGTSGSPSLTMGSDVVIDSGDAGGTVDLSYDTTNNKVFLAYENSADTQWKGAIGTVTSGTNAISFTTPALINDYSSEQEDFTQTYDAVNNKIYFIYKDKSDGDDLTYRVITPGASSFSVGSAIEISSDEHQVRPHAASFGTGKGVVVGLINASSKLSYTTFNNNAETNLTKDNYLGISKAAISDGATGKIVIPGGISEGHSSLTIDSNIFTNGAGTIGLAGDSTGLQFLGRAVSATQIQLQEEESDFYAEADGAITAGAPIEIDTTSGKIKAIVGSTINTKKTNDHHTGDIEYHDLMYDPDTDRYVAFYSDLDDNGYGKGVVGQYSSGTNDISWGTPVAFTSTYINGTRNIASGYDEGVDRALVAYNTNSDGSYKGWARVVTITGGTSNTVAFGTAATYHSSQVRQQTVVYDTGEARCLIVFFTEASPEKCGGIVAQITGGTTNTVAYGTEQFLNSSNNVEIASAHFNPKRNKTLAFYADPGDSLKMKIQEGTITAGTNALSWGSENNADYGNTSLRVEIQSAYIPSLEASIVFHNRSSKLYGHLVRPNFSTNPWYGSVELINHNHRLYSTSGIATSDTGSENVVIVTRSDTDSLLRYIPFAVTGTGTQITAATATQLESGRANNAAAVTNVIYDPDAAKYVITSKDSTDDNHGLTYIINLPVASTKANFDGFANFAASSGNAVGVALEAGIDDNQSGLTIGSTYYVDSDTTLTTTSTSNTQVGRAISATAIQVVTTT